MLVQKGRLRASQPQPDKTATTFPAPTGGLVENANLALGRDAAARVIENGFPTLQGVRVRGGCKKSAKIGARVRAMFSYKSAASEKLFAATSSAIYDISALNPNAIPSAAVSGLTSGAIVTAQMGTSGGEYLYACNGVEKPRLFDGSVWTAIDGASTPAITGVTTTLLSYVWVHKNRLWFIEKGTKRAWYLPTGSIGGAANPITLDGVFIRGGSLLFGATVSQDSGDGMDDRQVFVSTEGEVAVYAGTDPSSASAWGLVGRYDISPAMGALCHMRAGGDLLIGTKAGIVPLSAVTEKDPAALDVSAISAAVEPSWRRESRLWDGVQGWQLLKWPQENMMLATFPHRHDTCFVANLQSGKWAKYTGWDVQCGALFGGLLYFGDSSGDIFLAESGGNDNGAAYVFRVSWAPATDPAYKSVGAMRATFLSVDNPIVQLSISPDYAVSFPSLPQVYTPVGGTGALWDVALWDQALWDDDGLNNFVVRPVYSTGWRSVGFNGYAIAPQVQIVVNGPGRPTAELISVDVMIEQGGTVA